MFISVSARCPVPLDALLLLFEADFNFKKNVERIVRAAGSLPLCDLNLVLRYDADTVTCENKFANPYLLA